MKGTSLAQFIDEIDRFLPFYLDRYSSNDVLQPEDNLIDSHVCTTASVSDRI